MSQLVPDVAQAIVDLDGWLETMRQPGGYGGPVAHWWQSRYRYTGPGLDWRYEGVLSGYQTLLAKTGAGPWRERIARAAADLRLGQLSEGSYRASRFEANPDSLGTPHEAAATLGLLLVAGELDDPEAALAVAGRNLDNLIERLWDGVGFNDRPGVAGRVPNKLATLAQALLAYAGITGQPGYLPYAQAALADLLRYQVRSGRWRGAFHQYAAGAAAGDGRYFPYYAARCVPPLVTAYQQLSNVAYLDAARDTLSFLERTMDADGSWPQVIYDSGARAEWPRWCAGKADILLAFAVLDEGVPAAALESLLSSQLPSGGFRTGVGFASQISQRAPVGPEDYRDVTPVVGWNDKVLRLLCRLLDDQRLPEPRLGDTVVPVSVWGRPASYRESAGAMTFAAGDTYYYLWRKDRPWADVVASGLDVR